MAEAEKMLNQIKSVLQRKSGEVLHEHASRRNKDRFYLYFCPWNQTFSSVCVCLHTEQGWREERTQGCAFVDSGMAGGGGSTGKEWRCVETKNRSSGHRQQAGILVSVTSDVFPNSWNVPGQCHPLMPPTGNAASSGSQKWPSALDTASAGRWAHLIPATTLRAGELESSLYRQNGGTKIK